MTSRIGWIEVSKAAGIAVFVGIIALAFLGPRAPVQAEVPGPVYVGSRKCKKCHRKQHKSFEKTKMAGSFTILAPGERADAKTKAGLDPNADYRTDDKCLKCHTVGFGHEGGFQSGMDLAEAEKAELLGVGCEGCHGPAGGWLQDGIHDKDLKDEAVKAERMPQMEELGFAPKPEEKNCTGCHNDESPNFQAFDFEKRKDEGTHEHFK